MKKTIVTIIILSVLLIGIIGYMGFTVYSNSLFQERVRMYNVGYKQAFVDVVRAVSTCQEVPLKVGNQTINIVASECLKKV